MKVKLKHCTPMYIAVEAALTCTGNENKALEYKDNPEKFLIKLIDKGHESVIEHLVCTFKISDISRALLQELARHRHISLSVLSTRWALHKGVYVKENVRMVRVMKELLEYIADNPDNLPNDELKYYIPECVLTNAYLTCNLRELRHIFKLRMAPEALKEFRELCWAMYDELPDDYKVLCYDVLGERRE